jgi:hypothetical protein
MLLWSPAWLTDQLPTSTDPIHGWPPAWWIAGIMFLLLAVLPWMRPLGPRGRTALLAFLSVAAVVSIANYLDYGRFRYGSYVNEWDSYHYYLGTKYAPELGYDGLYLATLLADVETVGEQALRGRKLRSLSDYRFSSAEESLPRAEAQRARFSDARWQGFKTDVGWFRDSLPAERWRILLEDAGYNGTPPWTLAVGTLLSNRLDIATSWQRALILMLDPLLLVLAAFFVWRAFGTEVALLLIIFLGTHYLLSWGHLKGAILRTDFAALAVLCVALMKLRKPGAAGAALAWASVSRVFPGFLALGLLARLSSKELDPEERSDIRRFFAWFAGLAALAVVASLLRDGGLDAWRQWIHKISLHELEGSHWDVGLSTLFDVEFIDGVPEYFSPRSRFSEEPSLRLAHALTLWACRLAIAVPALVFARSQPPDRALSFGFVFVFVLSSAAYYYYLILLVPLLYFAEQRERPFYGLSAGFMFLTGAAGYLLFSGYEPLAARVVALRGWGQQFQTYYYLSWAIGITAVSLLAVASLEARAASTDDAGRIRRSPLKARGAEDQR